MTGPSPIEFASPAPPATDTTTAGRVRRNLASLREQGAPQEVIDRYMRSIGATPVEDSAARDNPYEPRGNPYENPYEDNPYEHAAPATVPEPPRPHVGIGEGLLSSGLQGATLGLSDEGAAAIEAFGPGGIARAIVNRQNPISNYRSVRDGLRARQAAFATDHPVAAGVSEFAGGVLPAVATGNPASLRQPLLRAVLKSPFGSGALFGGASAVGHGEGSAWDQAKGTALGTTLGAALGTVPAAARLARRAGGMVADMVRPARIAERAAATLLPDNAAATLARREALTPGTAAIGDLTPQTAGLARMLSRSPRAAITSQENGAGRVAAVKASRKAVGAEYDALNQPLQADDELQMLLERAGVHLDDPATDFANLHRIRHDISKAARSATGMAKNDLYEIRNGVDSWLQARVPGLDALDSKYTELTQHLGGALRSLKEATTGAALAARREVGRNTRGADRSLGLVHALSHVLRPSPARVAEATEQTLFTPANTQAALGRVLDARARILAPESQLASRSARVLGALAGNLAAPALSTNAVMARTLAAQLRDQGASDSAVAQQLGSVYTPEVVRFVVAATPARIPQGAGQ